MPIGQRHVYYFAELDAVKGFELKFFRTVHYKEFQRYAASRPTFGGGRAKMNLVYGSRVDS